MHKLSLIYSLMVQSLYVQPVRRTVGNPCLRGCIHLLVATKESVSFSTLTSAKSVLTEKHDQGNRVWLGDLGRQITIFESFACAVHVFGSSNEKVKLFKLA